MSTSAGPSVRDEVFDAVIKRSKIESVTTDWRKGSPDVLANTFTPIVVYLSSTLKDLQEERNAIKDVLSGTCVVKESYDPSDANLVKKCLDDVGTCEVYIGVIGLRYGFIPPGETLSITQLEYERAKSRGLARYMFIKNDTPYSQTDAGTGERSMDRIEAFRKQLTSGAPEEPTPAHFSTVPDLRFAVQKMISDIRIAKSGGAMLMKGDPPHPWAITYEVSIGCVPGTDEQVKGVIEALARCDQRITFFDLSPAQPTEYFSVLDAQARKSRSVMLLITAASLSRLASAADTIADSATMIRARCSGVFGLLVDAKLDALPPKVLAALTDVFASSTSDWSNQNGKATFEKLQLWRRARAPESHGATRVGVPYMVVALNEDEASSMHGEPDTLFRAFGTGADLRRTEYDALSKRLELSPGWPNGFYGPRREQWHPFGPGTKTMKEFVLAAADRVNRASRGSRERRLMRTAQLSLIPYDFDEYLKDRSGSRENVKLLCELGCLVLLDEFALLHPTLRREIDELLSSNNAAVVSISACDPTQSSLGELLGGTSYLRVGNLLSRFGPLEDLRCELALNSAERLQRWLRLVLPELVSTLGQGQIDPALDAVELLRRPIEAST